LELTPGFVDTRIAVLGDPHNAESQRFASLYGMTYYQQVLDWFQRAAADA